MAALLPRIVIFTSDESSTVIPAVFEDRSFQIKSYWRGIGVDVFAASPRFQNFASKPQSLNPMRPA